MQEGNRGIPRQTLPALVTAMHDDLSRSIRSIPDFPKPGIVFRDITTLLKDPTALREAADAIVARYAHERIATVVGIESRGFILGSIVAYRLGAGFVPARKPGKLPAPAVRETYQLEYGSDAVEIHADAIAPGDRVLVHDDLLATGGTAAAACALVERLGGTIVGVSVLIELAFLHGRLKLPGRTLHALITYAEE
jgi:adenine phosphoribosyltransferase